MSKWFLVSSLLLLKIKQGDCVLLKRVWFGPWKSFGFFQTWTEVRLLRHPAFPLVHQLFPVRTLDTFMMIFYIYLYLLAQIIWTEAPWNIEDFNYLLLFIDVELGATCGGKLALRAAVAGGRRQYCTYVHMYIPSCLLFLCGTGKELLQFHGSAIYHTS